MAEQGEGPRFSNKSLERNDSRKQVKDWTQAGVVDGGVVEERTVGGGSWKLKRTRRMPRA